MLCWALFIGLRQLASRGPYVFVFFTGRCPARGCGASAGRHVMHSRSAWDPSALRPCGTVAACVVTSLCSLPSGMSLVHPQFGTGGCSHCSSSAARQPVCEVGLASAAAPAARAAAERNLPLSLGRCGRSSSTCCARRDKGSSCHGVTIRRQTGWTERLLRCFQQKCRWVPARLPTGVSSLTNQALLLACLLRFLLASCPAGMGVGWAAHFVCQRVQCRRRGCLLAASLAPAHQQALARRPQASAALDALTWLVLVPMENAAAGSASRAFWHAVHHSFESHNVGLHTAERPRPRGFFPLCCFWFAAAPPVQPG